jgi:hypothetical protein
LRSVLIIFGGIVLFGVCIACVKWLGSAGATPMTTALRIFLPLWLALAAFNMWFGVSQAGYKVAEEFPIFLAIFGVPAIIALVLWKFL